MNVAVEPLASLLEEYGCAAVPSIHAPADSVFFVHIANPSNRRIDISVGLPVAAIAPVAITLYSTSAAAVAPQLSRNEKLRKVLHELHVDTLSDSTPHKRSLVSLMCKYIDIFAESDADVGTTSLAFHEIDKDDTRPLRQFVRRLPYGEVPEAIVNEIEKLTIAGIARPSSSPWASPVVMGRKKDGGWRMCVDYRRLNSVTKFDCFPLPRLNEALDAFAGATVFSSLDLAMAYHQVPVKPADVEKTAFITHVGLFEMAKMPLGLCNAPSTYQRLMISVLQGLISRICFAYLDDVIVFSKRRADHVNDLRAVLDRIRDAGLKLKPAKCNLFWDEVLYLGHVISAAGVSFDPAKLRVLADWPLPTTVCELQLFLGFVNFYGDFIDEQTALTASLYDMTAARKGTEQVHFSAEDVERFTEIKRRLCAAPRLAHPNIEAPFTLYTDASKIAVGAVLLQRDASGVERAISFFSKKLSSAQRNYSACERECLAVICALEHFRVYLLARPFRL